jgi:hypothetical protein
MGSPLAIPAPAKAASATGGVTFESCEYQKITRWAIRIGMPNSLVSSGAASTASTM